MSKFIAPAILALTLAASGGAYAATAPASGKPAPAKVQAHAGCVKQWKAQKTHTQSKKDFLAACAKAG